MIWPSHLHSFRKRASLKAQRVCPVEHGHRASVQREFPVIVAIKGLFPRRGPAAIARLVVPVVVGITINRLSFRSFAHVSQKVFERVPPSVADRDTHTAVSLIIGGGRVMASLIHRLPAFICRRLNHAMCSDLRACLASAVPLLARSHRCRSGHNAPSAVAITEPPRTFVFRFGSLYNNQFPVASSNGYIDFSWHVLVSIKNVLARLAWRVNVIRAASILA